MGKLREVRISSPHKPSSNISEGHLPGEKDDEKTTECVEVKKNEGMIEEDALCSDGRPRVQVLILDSEVERESGIQL